MDDCRCDYRRDSFEHLSVFTDGMNIAFNKTHKFCEFHKRAYPEHVKNIEEGVALTRAASEVKGPSFVANVFIGHTYKSWEKDGKIDRDTTLKCFLNSIVEVTNKHLDGWDTVYHATPEDILDDLWDTVQSIVKCSITYTYCMRDPYFDVELGKTKFRKAFPSGTHKMSVSKLRKVWDI